VALGKERQNNNCHDAEADGGAHAGVIELLSQLMNPGFIDQQQRGECDDAASKRQWPIPAATPAASTRAATSVVASASRREAAT
jgi:hypothetical protein